MARFDDLADETIAIVFGIAVEDVYLGTRWAVGLSLLARRYLGAGRAVLLLRVDLSSRRATRGLIAALLRMPIGTRRIRRLGVSLVSERRRRAGRAWLEDQRARRARGEKADDDLDEYLAEEDAGHFYIDDDEDVNQFAPPVSDDELYESAQLLVTTLTILDGPVGTLDLSCYPEHLPLLAACPDVSAAVRGGRFQANFWCGRIDEGRPSGDIVEAARTIATMAAEADRVGIEAGDWEDDSDEDGLAVAVAAAPEMRAHVFWPTKGPAALINALAFRMPRLRSVDEGVCDALAELSDVRYDYRGRIQSMRSEGGGIFADSVLPSLVSLKRVVYANASYGSTMQFALPPSLEIFEWEDRQAAFAVRALLESLPPSSQLRRLSGPIDRGSSDASMAPADARPFGGLVAVFAMVGTLTAARHEGDMAYVRAECERRGITLDCGVSA